MICGIINLFGVECLIIRPERTSGMGGEGRGAVVDKSPSAGAWDWDCRLPLGKTGFIFIIFLTSLRVH